MSSMTTTDNKAFLNELARLVGHSPAHRSRKNGPLSQGLPGSGQGDALAVVFLAHYWNCGGC